MLRMHKLEFSLYVNTFKQLRNDKVCCLWEMGFAIIECEPPKVTNILHLMFNWVKSFLIKVLHSFWHCWVRFCDRIAYEQNFLDFMSVSAVFLPQVNLFLLPRNPDEQLCQNIDVLLKPCEWQIRKHDWTFRKILGTQSTKCFDNITAKRFPKTEIKLGYLSFPTIFTTVYRKKHKTNLSKVVFLHILCH